MEKCKICNKEFKSKTTLIVHIKKEHIFKEYYDLHIKKENEGNCEICGETTNFHIRYKNAYDKTCSKKCKSELNILKRKKTWQNNYGVDHPHKNMNIILKKKKTCLEKYGDENFINIEKQKETNLEKYGVEYTSQFNKTKEKIKKSCKKVYKENNIIDKRKKTMLKKYGVEHSSNMEDFEEKRRKTRIKNFNNPTFNNQSKIKNTCNKKYGCNSPMQNEEIFIKNQKSGCQAKPFKNLYYRGSFELDFLEKYYDKFNIQQGLTFDYEFEGTKRKYFSDFYLPDFNLIVEIKSSYYYKKNYKIMLEKEKASINEGFNYLIIIDKDYSKLISILNQY